ncbi:MAG: stage V sporulation protein AD [Oscillospiraceae bacterium]
MGKRIGKATIELINKPSILGYAAYVGKKEHDGPLAKYFINYDEDTKFGKDSWEKAESELQRRTFELARKSAGLENTSIDISFAGDLLNQCIASGYSIRETGIPFVGLYGACSTMAESLLLASVFVDSDSANIASAQTSSHFCAAERQFRFPLEYGGMRTPSSQWTVTGSGCVMLGKHRPQSVCVERVCFGRIVDLDVSDINNMGSAMAPSAADTLVRFLKDTQTVATDYSVVVTGDLGDVGSRIFSRLCCMEGYDVPNHLDCGKMIFDADKQNVKAGGSGCGCSASVLCSYFLPSLEKREMRRILFMATGALMSPTSFQQGESIPCVAHLADLKFCEK